MINRIGYISLFLILSFSSFAQVSFKAKADRYKVGRNEEFTVEFTINSKPNNFKGPNFDGFKVIGAPSQSETNYLGTSGLRQSYSVAYTLMAKKPGKYTIGSAYAVVDEETYETRPFQITVTQETTRPNSPYDLAEKMAFLKVLASKTTVYQGEPIVAAYKVYFKTNIGNPSLLEEPDYTGFFKENIDPKRIPTSSERYNGEAYKTAVIHRRLLLPQKSGKIKPGAVEMRIPTPIPSNRRDIFGRRLNQTINQTASVRFPTITVKPLPESGKPDNFAGAVGRYSMDVSISRNEVEANESVTLKVKLSGDGNIKLIELPEPEIPSAFEAYDPKYSENIKVDIDGMRGSKTYEYLLIPRYGGTYKIPPVEFSYFDTKAKKYRTLSSNTFEITVNGGAAQPNTQSTGPGQVNQEEVSFINKDILFIKTKPGNLALKGSSFFGSVGFYLGIALSGFASIAMILFFLFRKSRKEDQTKVKQGRANKVARKHLQEAKKMLDANDNDGFYQALSAALLGYFSDKLNIPNSRMSKDIIQEELSGKGVENSSIQKALELMNRAELARFTSAASNSSSDYEETATVITEIEKQLG